MRGCDDGARAPEAGGGTGQQRALFVRMRAHRLVDGEVFSESLLRSFRHVSQTSP